MAGAVTMDLRAFKPESNEKKKEAHVKPDVVILCFNGLLTRGEEIQVIIIGQEVGVNDRIVPRAGCFKCDGAQ